MPNWFLYYRLLRATHSAFSVRLELQDVLCDLRDKAAEELKWSDQQTQDFFESLTFGDDHGTPLSLAKVTERIERERKRLEEYGL